MYTDSSGSAIYQRERERGCLGIVTNSSISNGLLLVVVMMMITTYQLKNMEKYGINFQLHR